MGKKEVMRKKDNKFRAYESCCTGLALKVLRYDSKRFIHGINAVLEELKPLCEDGFSKIGIVKQLNRIQELIDKYLESH